MVLLGTLELKIIWLLTRRLPEKDMVVAYANGCRLFLSLVYSDINLRMSLNSEAVTGFYYGLGFHDESVYYTCRWLIENQLPQIIHTNNKKRKICTAILPF